MKLQFVYDINRSIFSHALLLYIFTEEYTKLFECVIIHAVMRFSMTLFYLFFQDRGVYEVEEIISNPIFLNLYVLLKIIGILFPFSKYNILLINKS